MAKKAAAKKPIDKPQPRRAGNAGRQTLARAGAKRSTAKGKAPARGSAGRGARARAKSHGENAGIQGKTADRDRDQQTDNATGGKVTLEHTAIALRAKFPKDIDDYDRAALLNTIALTHMEDGYGLLSSPWAANAIELRDGKQIANNMVMNSQTGQVFVVLEEVEGELKACARPVGNEAVDRFVAPLSEPKMTVFQAPTPAERGTDNDRRHAAGDSDLAAQLNEIREDIIKLIERVHETHAMLRGERSIKGKIADDGSTISGSIDAIEN